MRGFMRSQSLTSTSPSRYRFHFETDKGETITVRRKDEREFSERTHTSFEEKASGNSENGFDIFDDGRSRRRRQTEDGSIGKLALHHV